MCDRENLRHAEVRTSTSSPFDDEPYRDRGGRMAIKAPENRRPDPFATGSGRARLFGT